jgi:hypothetical protein
MPKKLRPAVDLMAFKFRTLKVNGEEALSDNRGFYDHDDGGAFSENSATRSILIQVVVGEPLVPQWMDACL